MDPAARQWIETVLAGSPVARHLGIRVAEAAKDRVVLALPFSVGNVTLADIVHGGVIATLIDIAGAAASGSGIDGTATGGATASLSIAYLAPAKGCDLTAEAVIVQRGRSQTVSDVVVRDDAGTMVAKGLVVSRIFSARGGT